MQSNTVCVRALTNNTLIQRELCSCKVCETLHIQERKNVWASRINLKKNQGLRALPLLQPSSQVCSTHILQLNLGACGGCACQQQSSAGSQTSSPPVGSPAPLHFEQKGRVAFLFWGKCQCEFSAYWKESMPNSIIRNASAVVNYSILFQSSIILQNYEMMTDQVSVPASTKSLNQCIHAYWKSSLAHWELISTKLVTWAEDVGAGNGHKDKDALKEGDSAWVVAQYPPAWPALELAQTGAGQRVYIVFSKCEKILIGKLCFCSFPSLLCRAEHKDIDITFDYFKHLRNWETRVMHRYLCQSICHGSRWRNPVCVCVCGSL